MKFKRRGKNQGPFFQTLILLLFLGIISELIFSNWRMVKKDREFQIQIENLKREVRVLEKENAKLRAGISQTKKESYWEERVRQEGYKKPGEEQVVVLPPEKIQKEKTEEKNLWQRFLEKIGF